MASLGFKIDARPAEDVVGLATAAEGAGVDELWVCEDLGLAGGIAQVAAALAATERLRVGLGIAPAAVRNPMYLAMEFAAVDRISNGRFHAGIGHGMPRWLRQVGQHPASLMTCLREVGGTVHQLLSGATVSVDGEHVQLDDVALVHPPRAATPISLGIRGPKGVQLVRDLGFGVILAEGSPADYVARVRRELGPHARITVFVWSNIDPEDSGRAKSELAGQVAAALEKDYLAEQLGALHRTACDVEAISRLTVSGDPAGCRSAVGRLVEAGADAVVLQPILGREEQQIALIGEHLVGRV